MEVLTNKQETLGASLVNMLRHFKVENILFSAQFSLYNCLWSTEQTLALLQCLRTQLEIDIYIFMEKFFSVNKHDKYSILSTHELQILKILQTVSNVIHASGYGQVYILD